VFEQIGGQFFRLGYHSQPDIGFVANRQDHVYGADGVEFFQDLSSAMAHSRAL
jgi:hypothetical protein